MKLTEAEILFLRKVAAEGRMALATRAEDRVRQKLRRRGFVVFDRDEFRWRILPAGRQALNQKDKSDE